MEKQDLGVFFTLAPQTDKDKI